MTHTTKYNLIIVLGMFPLFFFTCNLVPKEKPEPEHVRQIAPPASPYSGFDSALRQAYAQSDSNAKALGDAIKAAKESRVTIMFSRPKVDTFLVTPKPFGDGYK